VSNKANLTASLYRALWPINQHILFSRRKPKFKSRWIQERFFSTSKLLFRRNTVSKLLFKKYERYTLYRSYCSKKQNVIRCIEVTVRKNRTLYAVSKLLFKKNERYTLYQSYFLKKPNAICCIEATFQSNCGQLWRLAYLASMWINAGSTW